MTEGKITRERIEQKTPAPASGFVFNTRRKLFEDPRVREALIMAFDFEWANANLFANAYRRTYGYFAGSELSSEGKPVDAREKAVLGEAAARLRPDFIDGSYRLPVSDGSGRDRKLLRKAVGLLAEAGWTVTDKGLANAAGEPFTFTITVQNRDQEKIALHYQRTLKAIGIKAEVRIVDSAQFSALQTSYDFDMIPATWFNSLSPGNEQMLYFGSEGRTPRERGTIRASPIPRSMPPSRPCWTPPAGRISSPPSMRRTGFSSRASTWCRSSMRAASGWPAGTTSDGRTSSRFRASRRRHSGATPEPSGRGAASRFNLARYCLSGKPQEKTALIVAGPRPRTLELRRARGRGAAAAEGLRRSGLEPGERMFIRMGNSVDFALLFFAANAMGAVPIPASPMLTPAEVEKLLPDRQRARPRLGRRAGAA